LGAWGSVCVVGAFFFSLISIGSTGALFSDDTLSPANAFSAGTWDTPAPQDPSPQVDVSAPENFSLVVLPDASSTPADDSASSTPPVDDSDASSTPTVVISAPTITIDTDDASSTSSDISQ